MIKNIEEFTAKLSEYTQEEREQILAASRRAQELHKAQLRDSGEPYFIHPLQVAEILVDIRMDAQTITAALLHDVLEDTLVTRQDLRKEYGREVESLVNGVTKINIVKAKNKNVQEAETIRKMLFAMVKDIRVILIKLADKLHNMRTLQFKPEVRRKAIAQECLDIYAPLAGRLGISGLKDELEDLSLKHLNHDAYEQIKSFVAQKRGERADYLVRVETAIYEAAAVEKLDVEVETRAKHFYSIYQKMKRRSKAIDEIFDLLGIRILCRNQTECYTLLGIVHQLWMPIEGRFKDYIAMPKANKYQSLHTTVMCYGGKLIEIQIRTLEMHRIAEYGVAAHWLYKQQLSSDGAKPEDLAIISRVKSLNSFRITSNEFLDEIKRELLKDSIYVFTPKGDAIELPKGSTPIDFAYHIHTEVGNHCMGAKADGVIVPLKEELKNTQVIEVMTSPQSHPHVNWLRYVRTTHARSKIRSWLNRHDENLIIDRNIVARKKADHPRDDSRPTKSQHAAHSTSQPDLSDPNARRDAQQIMDTSKVGIRIGNERNMMIRFAQCCNPSTGDDIIGYVSRGRGIIVHKRDCSNVHYITDFKERTIEVEWETVSPKATRRFRVTARRTLDLFSEIEGAVRKYKGHLIEGKIEETDMEHLEAVFTMELERRDDFKQVMKSIRTVPAVLNLTEVGQHSSEPLNLGI